MECGAFSLFFSDLFSSSLFFFFFYPLLFFFFPLFSVEMCRQLVEKPRDAGEMLVRCGMRLPLGDPSQAGSE